MASFVMGVESKQESEEKSSQSNTSMMGRTLAIPIRASVDALCRDGPGEISRDRLQRGGLTRQGTTSLASKAHRYDSQTHM